MEAESAQIGLFLIVWPCLVTSAPKFLGIHYKKVSKIANWTIVFQSQFRIRSVERCLSEMETEMTKGKLELNATVTVCILKILIAAQTLMEST